MRIGGSWLLSIGLAAGTTVLLGCQSEDVALETDANPQLMSNVRTDLPLAAPDISSDMQRFDAGIGDTGTGTGGGGAYDPEQAGNR